MSTKPSLVRYVVAAVCGLSLYCALSRERGICCAGLPGDANAEADDELKPQSTSASPANPGHELSGIVVTPDGRPAAGAQVAIANWTTEVKLENGALSYVGLATERGLKIIKTDAEGRFRLPPEADPQVIVSAYGGGFAEVDDPRSVVQKKMKTGDNQLAPSLPSKSLDVRIVLQNWGRVMGTLRHGDQPVAGAKFRLGSSSSKQVRQAPVRATHFVETNSEGRFVALRMPPGRAWCQRLDSSNDNSNIRPLDGLNVQFDVTAGQIARLELGGPGQTVVGRVIPPDGFLREIAWSKVNLSIAPRAPTDTGIGGMAGGMGIAGANPRFSWLAVLTGDEGKRYQRYLVDVAEDGSFRVEDLPPADYVVLVSVKGHAVAGEPPPEREVAWGAISVRLSPAREDASEKPVDVGDIRLSVAVTRNGTNHAVPAGAQLQKSGKPDDKAQALALRAHAMMAAIDKLPRFYYRTEEGNGDVETLRDREGSTLEGLKLAIDGPVLENSGRARTTTLAWSGMQSLSAHAWSGNQSQSANRGDSILQDGVPHLPQCRVWTVSAAWARTQTEGKPPRFNFVRDHESLTVSWSDNAFFRVTPHRFWWGYLQHRGYSGSLIQPELTAYRSVETEKFDGELCDVVESARRMERLWISRTSGLLRGVLNYNTVGPYSDEPFYKSKAIEKIASRSFANQTEYANWANTMSHEQAVQLAIAYSDIYSGMYEPRELICFRNYREITRGVWVPFRQDRAFARPVTRDFSRHNYSRGWTAVQDVRIDIDLTDTIRKLQPKDGDQIYQDQRFGLPVSYEYRSDRTPRDVLKLVNTERVNPRMAGFSSSLTWPIEHLIGQPAPELPAEVWIGGRPPKLAGQPYLLHFWAVWCDPCKVDFPTLKKLAGEGATVIGIHPAGTLAEGATTVTEVQKLAYPTLLAPMNTPDHFDQRIAGFPVWAFPYCVLVDAQGKIAAHGSLDPDLLEKFRVLRERE